MGAALARSTNGLHERVSSSPSQNSIESTISSSSCDDVPPPLPVKQNAGLADANTGPPPEKPALHANFTLLGIEEDAGQPPPPPFRSEPMAAGSEQRPQSPANMAA